jgi:hypothetical protein
MTKPRPYIVSFTKRNGQPGESGPYTLEEAQHRLRSTHWGYRADPKIVKVKP